MCMCSQNTAFFYIDDHEPTPIKGNSQDFSTEIIGQAANIKSSINLQLSLPHSWELVYFSGQCFAAPDITDSNCFYPGLIFLFLFFCSFFLYPLVTAEEEEETFAFNWWSWEHRRLHAGSVKTRVSTSGCQQELRILPGVRSEAGLPVTQKDKGRANRLWFWMMGKHHSKDDVWIVPSCTRDLEMWFILQPGAKGRGEA